jgi:hypothetical protein
MSAKRIHRVEDLETGFGRFNIGQKRQHTLERNILDHPVNIATLTHLIRHNQLSPEQWEKLFRIDVDYLDPNPPRGIPYAILGQPTWLFARKNGNVPVFVLDLHRRCEKFTSDEIDQIRLANLLQIGHGEPLTDNSIRIDHVPRPSDEYKDLARLYTEGLHVRIFD